MSLAPPGVCGLLAGVLLASACGHESGRGTGPGVLLIAIDGLRADHLSVQGYERETSPVLAALAAQGLRFETVFASAPLVLPAHAALLSGCQPTVARRFLTPEFEGPRERRWRLPERGPHLAVEFLAAGYATAAFLDGAELDESHGFARGFQHYEQVLEESAEEWEAGQTSRVCARFLQWLRGLPAEQPWFAYLHLARLERSWSAPAPAATGFFVPRPELSQLPPVANTDSVFFTVPRSRWRGGVRSLAQYEAAYDDEIRLLDQDLGELCANLRRMNRFEQTSLHCVGSFGLQLGEAGLYLRAGGYSQADLAVPWIVRPRAGLAPGPGRVVPGLVSLVDVAPTLLALEGLAPVPGMHGRSQASALRTADGRAAARDFVFASCGLQEGCAVIGTERVLEVVLPLGAADAQLRRSWTGEWSELSAQPQLSFYDWRTGPPPPGRQGPLGDEAELAPFRQVAVDWLRDMNDLRLLLQAAPGRSGLDAETIERLRARGYVGP